MAGPLARAGPPSRAGATLRAPQGPRALEVETDHERICAAVTPDLRSLASRKSLMVPLAWPPTPSPTR
eukprot:7161946-Lingulodinium_polyedra.AAC.1